MSKLMRYKGYVGSIEVSIEDNVLHGEIQCINDVVMYEGDNPKELEIAFQEAVEDYLETCEELGKSPDKTFSGSFNIRIGSELHKEIFIAASDKGLSLNDYVKKALETSLASKELHMHIHQREDFHKPESFRYEISELHQNVTPLGKKYQIN